MSSNHNHPTPAGLDDMPRIFESPGPFQTKDLDGPGPIAPRRPWR